MAEFDTASRRRGPETASAPTSLPTHASQLTLGSVRPETLDAIGFTSEDLRNFSFNNFSGAFKFPAPWQVTPAGFPLPSVRMTQIAQFDTQETGDLLGLTANAVIPRPFPSIYWQAGMSGVPRLNTHSEHTMVGGQADGTPVGPHTTQPGFNIYSDPSPEVTPSTLPSHEIPASNRKQPPPARKTVAGRSRPKSAAKKKQAHGNAKAERATLVKNKTAPSKDVRVPSDESTGHSSNHTTGSKGQSQLTVSSTQSDDDGEYIPESTDRIRADTPESVDSYSSDDQPLILRRRKERTASPQRSATVSTSSTVSGYNVPETLRSTRQAMGESDWNLYTEMMEKHVGGAMNQEELEKSERSLFMVSDQALRLKIRRLVKSMVLEKQSGA
ncbi:unnamed protein product [Periconia digitata]|uniref:Uncharacterized protein n=1 Tax=Periconia digitata TaxID=1303443 RepID=A0A9W4UF27_9PLEO|nr:unnamed protein product [Periconia digitata]